MSHRALAFGLLVGVVAWAILWLGTTPRAGWDSLVYHKLALEYAGLSRTEQDAASWALFARYASPSLVSSVHESLDGADWHFDLPPSQMRWELQYRMRPAYPTLVAAAYPVLGLRAPLAVSALAVVLFVVTTLGGLWALAGMRVAVIATGLGLANLYLTPWLISLAPDGLAIALWAATLSAGALWVHQRRPVWLVTLAVAALALTLTRPLGILSPLVFGLPAIAAALVRADAWRAMAAATAVSAIPVVFVLVIFSAAGFPGVSDLLQDLPTLHYARPDIDDPVQWLLSQDLHSLTVVMPIGLLARPLVLVLVVGGIAGLLLTRRWWAATFLAALPVVLLSYLVHPSTTEIDRTLAPAWVSIHTGLGLLVVLGAARWRTQVLAWTDRFTRPEPGGGLP